MDLIYGVILSVVVHPKPQEYFLRNIIGDSAREVSFLFGFLGAFLLKLLSDSLRLCVPFCSIVTYWQFLGVIWP